MEPENIIIRLDDFPNEILTIIFSNLHVRDLWSLALTCKKFNGVVTDNNTLWRKQCDNVFLVRHASDHNGTSNNYTLSPYHHCRISSNWRRGFFRDTIIAPTNINYMPWLSLEPERLLVSTGSTLTCYPRDKRRLPTCQKNIWKITVPKVYRLGVRTNDISRFVVKDNVIVCGNRDGCIAVYDVPDSGSSENRLRNPRLRVHIRDCHRDGNVEVSAVDCVRRDDSEYCIISGSVNSKSVKFWKPETVQNVHFGSKSSREDSGRQRRSSQCAHSIDIHQEGARCMSTDKCERRLAVGLKGNGRPLIIDVKTGGVAYSPERHYDQRAYVRDIAWLDRSVVAYVTHMGYLTFFDCRTGDIVCSVLDPLATSLYSLKSDGQHAIVTGSSQLSRCVLYDVRTTKNCVQIMFTQKCSSPVYSVDFDATVLTAAAERGVAVLNFNVSTSGVTQRDYASIVRTFQ